MLWFKGYLVYFRKKMENEKKKHLLLLLGSLLLGGLIGMFWCFLPQNLHLNISQRASTVCFDDLLFLSGNTIDHSSFFILL